MTKRILVADDDDAIVDALAELFGEEGWSVKTSAGDNVVADVAGWSADLVLLDIWMSGQDGGQICCQLKADPRTGATPIILMSANRSVEDIACNCGADDFVAKPFDVGVLLDKVAALTDNDAVA